MYRIKRISWLVLLYIIILGPTSVLAAPQKVDSIKLSQTGTDDDVAAIVDLVEDMERAVLDQDVDLYLSYVDLSDSNFATEHTNWANDWGDDDYLTKFSLAIADIEFLEDGRAMGELTLVSETSYNYFPAVTAIFPVQFTYDEDNEIWLYAGEYWVTTETEHFLVHATPGMEDVAEELIPELPAIYEGVTSDYGHIPVAPMEIKLYESQETLWATVLMSLPMFGGWNEPNESLKLYAGNSGTLAFTVAHEFTHFLSFDQANQGQPLMPWWLLEGIAQLEAVPFYGFGAVQFDYTVTNVRNAHLTTGLIPWEDMADFEETPTEYWQYVYPQGYTFTRFVTEVYGSELRNEWIALQTLEMDIYEATEEVFGITFEELDAEFLEWLENFEAQ